MHDEAQRSAGGDGGTTATAPASDKVVSDETVSDAPRSTTDSSDTEPAYGAYYYDRLIGDYEVSGRYEYTGVWAEFFRVIAHQLVTRFDPKRTLDAGCAKGFLVQALREHPIEAFGVDASEYAISQAAASIKDHVRVGSITEPLGGPYDLITCIEVIEHVPDKDIELAISRLCEASDRIVFSSTPHDYVEPSHISVKAPEDWSALFAKRGFYRNFNVDASFLTPWAVIYERQPAGDFSQAIREYDRAILRQKLEIDELRKAVIKFSGDLDTVYGDVATDIGDLSSENAELKRQLAAMNDLHNGLQQQFNGIAIERDGLTKLSVVDRKELMRIRDLLIGKEHELGGTLGRITELESELQRFGELPMRYRAVVDSATWRIAWKLFSPYRKLRTLQAERGHDG